MMPAPQQAPAPPGDFVTTLEPMLLILGGAMTIAVGIFLVWLIRQMLREDRLAKAAGEHDRGDVA